MSLSVDHRDCHAVQTIKAKLSPTATCYSSCGNNWFFTPRVFRPVTQADYTNQLFKISLLCSEGSFGENLLMRIDCWTYDQATSDDGYIN